MGLSDGLPAAHARINRCMFRAGKCAPAFGFPVLRRMNPLQELFMDSLADMYDAEKRIATALPRMAKLAKEDVLRAAFEKHAEETKQQATELEKVFDSIGAKPKRKPCKATIGLLEEADEIASEHGETTAGDAALISAAQKVEHYEMATYGCLEEWARLLGHKQAARILGKIRKQEESTDAKLNKIALGGANEAGLESETGGASEMEKPSGKPRKKR